MYPNDHAYQEAAKTVRNRYRFVGNPMLLSNTLRTTMSQYGLDFRDAMLCVEKDDGRVFHYQS
jgi:hypothetical protein